MTYTNAEKMIQNATAIGSADTARRLCAALDNPEKRTRVIKVLGESGKTSTTILLSSAISAAGYRVGRLTVPHVHSVRESICVDEKPISIELYTASADSVKNAISEIKKDDADFDPSAYDMLTAIAFCAFEACDCDFALAEISSGTYSAIDDPILSVITTISDQRTAKEICARLDRQTGETVTAMQSREVYKLIFDRCAEINCRLSMPLRNSFIFMSASLKRVEFTYNTRLYSLGTGAYYQVYNMLTVLEATEALSRLGFRIPSVDICSAVLGQGIPLRFESISVMPTIIVDRADTEGRRRRLIEALKMQSGFISKKPIVICEGEKRKIYEEFTLMGRDVKVSEMGKKGARKAIKALLSSLDENDTVVILGSSSYCEEIAKITKEILMI